MNAQALWFLTRGTGAASLLMLTVSLILGVSTVGGVQLGRWPRFFTPALHRTVSLLVFVLLTVHILTAVLDTYVSIRLADAVLPFTGTYRPLWLGFGALAFDLLVAVTVTSLLRARLGFRAWRVVHWAAYACWPIALTHGLGTGSDAGRTWMLGLAGVCSATVVVAVAARVTITRGGHAGGRRGTRRPPSAKAHGGLS